MQNKRVNSSIMNREGLTPLDIAIIEVERGLTYYLTPTRWIFLCLIRTGALASPRGLDHFLRHNIAYPVLEKETRNHANLTRSLAIASAVIATVTFAAAFTMPGGYKADGTPVLAGRYTFKAFVIADTLAFILSILCTYSSTLSGSEVVHSKLRRFHAVWSSKLLVLGTKCMVAAFAFAIYVVLAPVSNGIGIVVYVMTSIMVLMFGTLSMIQLYKLAKTIKSRVGWAGLFKSHVPQQAWNSYNVARTIFQTILEASWIYIFIFLFALL